MDKEYALGSSLHPQPHASMCHTKLFLFTQEAAHSPAPGLLHVIFFFFLKQPPFLWRLDNSLSSLKSHFSVYLPGVHFTPQIFPQEDGFLPLHPCCSLSTLPWQFFPS